MLLQLFFFLLGFAGLSLQPVFLFLLFSLLLFFKLLDRLLKLLFVIELRLLLEKTLFDALEVIIRILILLLFYWLIFIFCVFVFINFF